MPYHLLLLVQLEHQTVRVRQTSRRHDVVLVLRPVRRVREPPRAVNVVGVLLVERLFVDIAPIRIAVDHILLDDFLAEHRQRHLLARDEVHAGVVQILQFQLGRRSQRPEARGRQLLECLRLADRDVGLAQVQLVIIPDDISNYQQIPVVCIAFLIVLRVACVVVCSSNLEIFYFGELLV